MSKVRYGFGLAAAALACALAGVSAPAGAQTPAAMPPAPFPGTEPIVAFGQNAAQNGIFFSLGYDEIISGLVAGGQKHGIMPVGNGSAGVIFDLQTLAGIPGASFHINTNWRSGEGVTSISASNVLLQYDQEDTQFYLSQFFWEQGFDNDRLDIEFGRGQPTFDFMFNDVSCAPLSSIQCAQIGSYYFMNNSSPFGYAQWFTRVNFQITPEVYVRAGLYNENPSQTGWFQNGFTWSTSHSVGTLIPVELGYQTGFASAAYPAKYDIGFYDDTSAYNKLTGSLKTGNAAANGPLARDRTAFWAQVLQTVWRPDRKTNQSLSAFADTIVYNGGGPFWSQYDVGLYDRAPFGASRPLDTVTAIMALYEGNFGYMYAGDSAAYQRTAAQRKQWAFEVNYAYTIIPGVTITPAFQYVLHPDNPAGIQTSPGDFHVKNDIVLAIQLALNPAAMFGFPVFAPH